MLETTQTARPPASVPYADFQREQARRIQAERMLDEAQPLIAWENELFANETLDANEKLILRRQWIVEHTHKPKEIKGQTLFRLDIDETAKACGISSSTVTRKTVHLKENGLMIREDTPYTMPDGREVTLVWEKLTDVVAVRPAHIAAAVRGAGHGGARKEKPKCECGGDLKIEDIALVRQERAICTQCGTVHVYTPRVVSGGAGIEIVETHEAITIQKALPLQDAIVEITEETEPLQDAKEELLQLAGPESTDIVMQVAMAEKADTPPLTASPTELLEQAAALLVEIAGDESQHAEMNQAGKKYGPVYHPFGLEDARAHLSGKSTRAARLLRQDGKTRALCFDGDTYAEMDSLRMAAHLLMGAGYVCLLEDSPAREGHAGGGHLWILFDALVEARAALRHVREIAPMLASVKEYWPAEKKNIRLPGGLYVTPEYSEQCKLYDTIGALVADNRRDAARALLTYQTPASIVPDYPPDPEPERKQPTVKPAARLAVVTGNVQFTTGQLVAWFNDRHRLEDILAPAEDGALPRAFPTWRDHGNEPNVVYYHNTQRWHDYGEVRNEKERNGDKLDLYVLVTYGTLDKKHDVLSELGREYRAELIGRNGQIVSCPDSVPPMSAEVGDNGRGGVSASDGPYAPPDRESLCCKSRDWQWNEAEQRYECGACHPREVRRDHAA